MADNDIINWTTKTFDLYINGTLAYSNANFLNQNLTGIEEVHAASYYTGNFDLDNVVLGDKSVEDAIAFLPKNGTISAGNSNVVSVSVNASNFSL